MTEQEWLTCADPEKMLEFLRGKASDRKLRLFAVACCRRIWPSLDDDRFRSVVEVAEKFADEDATDEELELADEYSADAWGEAGDTGWAGRERDAKWGAAAAIHVAHPDVEVAAVQVARHAAAVSADDAWRVAVDATVELSGMAEPATHSAAWVGRKEQAALFRDLFGTIPFRPVTLDAALLAWGGGTLPRLARTIYEDRAFDRMPELADALERAGCTNADILTHCRQAGEHVRGCWVVDLLLGKE